MDYDTRTGFGDQWGEGGCSSCPRWYILVRTHYRYPLSHGGHVCLFARSPSALVGWMFYYSAHPSLIRACRVEANGKHYKAEGYPFEPLKFELIDLDKF